MPYTWYNVGMNITKTVFFCLMLAAGGCTTFEPLRESQFVDENRRYILVEYAKGEIRETEFTTPTGVRLPFKSALQVRVTLPDGKQFIAYQNMSLVGNLYFTEDRKWEYFEEGTGCILAELAADGDGYLPRFQGVLCRNGSVKPVAERKPSIRSGGSTPQGFGRSSEQTTGETTKR